jgi:hypothetical protein
MNRGKVVKLDNIWLVKCPGCDRPHSIDERWSFNGDVNNPTFTPSLLVNQHRPEMRCHSFITNGEIQFLSDCYHSLAGETVGLEQWTEEDDY